MQRWVRSKREEMFPTLQEDPTGLRTIMEALRELDPEEQKDVHTWWSWLNAPTSWQLADMAESAQMENLDEEMALLQQQQKFNDNQGHSGNQA